MATMIINKNIDVLKKAVDALVRRGHVCFTAPDNAEAQKIMEGNPTVTWTLIVAQKRFPKKITTTKVYVPKAVLWNDMEQFWRAVNNQTYGLSPI